MDQKTTKNSESAEQAASPPGKLLRSSSQTIWDCDYYYYYGWMTIWKNMRIEAATNG